MKKLYGFSNRSQYGGDAVAIAVDAEGEVYANWISSCEGWSESDLRGELSRKADEIGPYEFEYVQYDKRATHPVVSALTGETP